MQKPKRGGLGRGFESLLGEAARDVIAQPEFEALKQIDAAKSSLRMFGMINLYLTFCDILLKKVGSNIQ